MKNFNLLSKVFVLLIFLFMSKIWFDKEGLSVKEMQILSISETHESKGLGFTKGYNVYPEDGEYAHIDHSRMGGIDFLGDKKFTAYVSVPVLVPIGVWACSELTGLGEKSSRTFFIFFTFCLVFLFFYFSKNYIEEKKQWIFNLLVLTPYLLFNFFYNDINLNSFVLFFGLLSYLSLLNFIKTERNLYLVISLLAILINFWSSFFIIPLFPLLLIHLIFDQKLSPKKRRFGIIVMSAGLILIFCSVIFYYAQLPDAIDKLLGRAVERINGVDGIDNYKAAGSIPIVDFSLKLVTRLMSSFTPIIFLLGLAGLYISTVHIIKSGIFKLKKINTLDLSFINLMLFAYGIPASFILYSGSFVHPYFTMQWIPFFTLSSFIGLNELLIRSGRYKKPVLIITMSLFIVFSVARSYVKISQKSMIDIFFNGEIPSWYKKTSSESNDYGNLGN